MEFSDEFGFGLVLAFASLFFVGFIPCFYLSHLYFAKVKLNSLLKVTLSLLSGIIGGWIIFNIYGSMASSATNGIIFKLHNYFGDNLPLLIILELVVILANFFFFRKQSGKKSATKRSK